MLRTFFGVCLVVVVGSAGVAEAGPIGHQQPYFTYSPGAPTFESFNWTHLEFAAFSAYGGYFANVRRPEFETPLPHILPTNALLGIDDEFNLDPYKQSPAQLSFLPGETDLFASAFTHSVDLNDENPQDGSSIPEPGTLALVGLGLLGLSRSLARRRSM